MPLSEEVLAKKGGDIVLRPNELTLGYGVATTRLVGVGHEVGLRYAHAWDVFAVSTYATVSLLFWYVGLIPDLATLRDRSRHRIGRKIYGMLAMGWRGSALGGDLPQRLLEHLHRLAAANIDHAEGRVVRECARKGRKTPLG